MGTFLKNFKTHRKLNLFKCPKFYRTNCDLLIISIFLQIFLLLVTVINCSEFYLIGGSGKSLDSSISYSANSNNNIRVNNINSNNRPGSGNLLLPVDAQGSSPLPVASSHSTIPNPRSVTIDTNKKSNLNTDNMPSNYQSNHSDKKRLIVFNSHEEIEIAVAHESQLESNKEYSQRLPAITEVDSSILDSTREANKQDANRNSYHMDGENNEKQNIDPDDEEDEDNDELDAVKLQQIIMQGLGLKTLPDASKMNISQEEYETKYNEYLTRVRERRKRELLEDYTFEYLEEVLNPVTLYSIKHNFSETKLYQMKHEENGSMRRRKRSTLSNNDAVYVRFPIEFDSAEMPDDVEEAVLRLLLSAKDVPPQQQQRHSYPHQHQRFHRNLSHDGRLTLNGAVTVKVYQLIEPYGRVWLASRTIEFDNINEPISSRWIELDVSKAVNGWLLSKQSNLGLEIVCDNCHQYNMYIMEDYSANSEPDFSPVLNIVGRFGMHREKRSRQHHHFMQASRRKPRKTDCVQENNKCCRHKMEVVFSEIKGYDFIIQPKTFDAGYCRGRCPPRYNPAHQHAFFQSLIWKQDKTKVPRPCCAPSKLAELEVLHVDEKNKNKLQVSTWKDMRVQECACS